LKLNSESMQLVIEKYNDGKLTGASYTFDGDNAVFKGAGLIIQNNNGEPVLQGDINGNLQMVGDFITYNNHNKAIELNEHRMYFYDWEGTERDDYVGILYSSRRESDADKPGIALGHNADAYMSLVYRNENSDTHYSYVSFDKSNVLKEDAKY